MRSPLVTILIGFSVCLLATTGCDGPTSPNQVPVQSPSAPLLAPLDPELAELDARLDLRANGCLGPEAGTPASLAQLEKWVRGECLGTCPRVICVPPSLLADRHTTASLELSRTDCTAAAPCVLRNALVRTSWSAAEQPTVHRMTVKSSHWWVRDLQVNGLAEEAQLAAAPVVVARPFPSAVHPDACKLPSSKVTAAYARIAIEGGASDVTLDRLTVQNGLAHMVSVGYGSDDVRVVRSVLRASVPQFETDLVGIAVGLETNDPTNVGPFAVRGVRILANEIYDIPGDGIHFYGPDCVSGDGTLFPKPDPMCVAPPPDYRAARIALNDIYLTAATQDTGITTATYPKNRPTALAENAVDIKSGSSLPAEPIVVEDNRMWGFRFTADVPMASPWRSPRTCGGSGSNGEVVVIHALSQEAPLGNIVVRRNLLLDAALGVTLWRQPHVTIAENLIAGIHPEMDDGTVPEGAPMSLSLRAPEAVVRGNTIQSWTQSPVRWIQLHDGVSDLPIVGPKANWGASIEDNAVCGPNLRAYFGYTDAGGGNHALKLGEWIIGSGEPPELEGMFVPTLFHTHGNRYAGGVSRFRFVGEVDPWVEDPSPCTQQVTFTTRLRGVPVDFGE